MGLQIWTLHTSVCAYVSERYSRALGTWPCFSGKSRESEYSFIHCYLLHSLKGNIFPLEYNIPQNNFVWSFVWYKMELTNFDHFKTGCIAFKSCIVNSAPLDWLSIIMLALASLWKHAGWMIANVCGMLQVLSLIFLPEFRE